MAHKIIGGSDTRCSACNGNADPWEKNHVRGGPGSMWREGSTLGDSNGCGAVFDEPSFSPYGVDISRFDEQAKETTRS